MSTATVAAEAPPAPTEPPPGEAPSSADLVKPDPLASLRKRLSKPQDRHDYYDALLSFTRTADKKRGHGVVLRLFDRRYRLKHVAEIALQGIIDESCRYIGRWTAGRLPRPSNKQEEERQFELGYISLLYFGELLLRKGNDPQLFQLTKELRVHELVGGTPDIPSISNRIAVKLFNTLTILDEDQTSAEARPRHFLSEPATRARILRLGRKAGIVDASLEPYIQLLHEDPSVGVSWQMLGDAIRTTQSVWLFIEPTQTDGPVDRNERGYRYSKGMLLAQAQSDCTLAAESALQKRISPSSDYLAMRTALSDPDPGAA